MLTGWVIGYIIALIVVVVIVVLATILILQARKIARQAMDIIVALDASRDNTAGLWDLADANASLTKVGEAAKEARRAVVGGLS